MNFKHTSNRTAQEVIASLPALIAIDGSHCKHNNPQHDFIVVKPGVQGYYALPYAANKTLDELDAVHERVFHARKPTDAEREAATIGSLCGWDIPGADPLNYTDD